MAGVVVPSPSLLRGLSSRQALRSFAGLPPRCPVQARASCFWSLASGPRFTGLRDDLRVGLNWQIERPAAFGTSMTCRAKDGGGGKKNKKQVVQPPPAQRDEKVIKKVEKVIKKVEKIPLKPRIQPAKILPKLSAKIPALRHENIYNIPNFLTFSRLLATPVIGYFIVYDQHLYAFSLFFYAAFTDVLDGWLARKYNLQTVVGSVVDPMADKALMTTLVSCMAINGSLPLPLAVLILGRDAALAVAAIYYRYASLPAPKTLKRYWDFSLPSAEVHPTQVSKYNTFLQLVLLGTMMCVGLLHDPVATKSAAGGLLTSVQDLLGGEESVRKMVMGMQYTVAATTVYSGLSYTWTKDAVKILGHDEALKLKQGFRGRMIVGGAFGAVTIIAAGLHLRDRIWNEDEVKEDEKLLFKASK